MTIDRGFRQRYSGFRKEDFEELQDFFETSSIGLHWVGADGTILRANAADYVPLGYSADEYIGHNISEFHADLPVIRDILERLGRNERLRDYRARLLCKDGSIRHALIDSSVLWRNGEFVHTRCFTRDDTERTLADDALREGEERYRTLAETLPSYVASFDGEGRATYVNGHWLQITGRSRDEMLGHGWTEIIHPDDLQALADELGAAASEGRQAEFEYRVRAADGSWRWFLASTSPVPGPLGMPAAWIAASADITDRKRAEDAVRESERRYRALIEGLGVAVYTTDAAGRITLFNEAAAELWGRRPELGVEEWCGSLRLYWPDGRPMAHDQCPMAVTLKENRAVRGGEAIAERPDGSRVSFVPYPTPLRDASGALIGAVNVLVDITDRKRAEESLREREQQLEAIFSQTTAGIAQTDLEGRFLLVNDRFCEIIGRTREELLGGTRMQDITHPDDLPRNMELFGALAAGGPDFNIEKRYVCADGAHAWVTNSVSKVCDANGAAQSIVAVVLDITERKWEQELLAYQLGLNETITENASVALLMMDRDGRVTFLNPAGEVLTGYREEDVIGEIAHDRFHFLYPDGRPYPATECPIERANKQLVPVVDHEDVFVQPDGTFYHVLCNVAPLDRDGEQIGALIEIRDVTEQKRAEARERFLDEATAALNSSLEYDRMLVDVARLAVPPVADVCVVGVFDGRPETVRFGTATTDAAQLPLVDELHVRRWPAGDGSSRTVDEVMRSGETLLVRDAPAWIDACAPDEGQRRHANALAPLSVICTPVMVRGEAAGMMSFVMAARSGRRYTDADRGLVAELARRAGIALENARLYGDLRDAAEDLRLANAAKDEFLGLVSHELKTPITTIYGNAEVLEKRGESLDPDRRAGAIADIRHESERLQRIIDNLLVLARLEGGQTLTTEPMLMKRTVQRLIDDHQRRFPRREIAFQDGTGLSPAVAAPEYIEQIVRNLLSNAEKYSPPDARIEVAIELDAGVAVRVLDRGLGIAPDEVDAVFTPFYRSPRASGAAAGAGIGLAVCKRLIEAQGGRIWAGPREGGGSEFGFAVPVADEYDGEET